MKLIFTYLFAISIILTDPSLAGRTSDTSDSHDSGVKLRKSVKKTSDRKETAGSRRVRLGPTRIWLKRNSKNLSVTSTFKLAADLQEHASKIPWLYDLFNLAASSGILFRNGDKHKSAFFGGLEDLITYESQFLPFILGREGSTRRSHSADFEQFQEALPKLYKAYFGVANGLKIIMNNGFEDLKIKQSYLDMFSEEFKSGETETTLVTPENDERTKAEPREYSVHYVIPMLDQVSSQRFVFSQALPLLIDIFETQIILGPYLKEGFTDRKQKQRFKSLLFIHPEKQQKMRSRFENILTRHEAVSNKLEAIIVAHDQKTPGYSPELLAARFEFKRALHLAKKASQSQKDHPAYEHVRSEIRDLEEKQEALLIDTCKLLADPDLFQEELEAKKEQEVQEEDAERIPEPRLKRGPSLRSMKLNLGNVGNGIFHRPSTPRISPTERKKKSSSSPEQRKKSSLSPRSKRKPKRKSADPDSS